jgi:hypothetical protein
MILWFESLLCHIPAASIGLHLIMIDAVLERLKLLVCRESPLIHSRWLP